MRHTYLQIVITLLTVVTFATPARAREVAYYYEQQCVVLESNEDSSKGEGSSLKAKIFDIIGVAIEQHSADSSSQAFRHTQRTTTRNADSYRDTTIMRSAQSSTRAQLYGFSNHRILFRNLARHYYINGLRRLII